jgi:hypothetical protein
MIAVGAMSALVGCSGVEKGWWLLGSALIAGGSYFAQEGGKFLLNSSLPLVMSKKLGTVQIGRKFESRHWLKSEILPRRSTVEELRDIAGVQIVSSACMYDDGDSYVKGLVFECNLVFRGGQRAHVTQFPDKKRALADCHLISSFLEGLDIFDDCEINH